MTAERKIEPIEAWAVVKGDRGLLADRIVAEEAAALRLTRWYEGLTAIKVRIVPDEPCVWSRLHPSLEGACSTECGARYLCGKIDFRFCPYCGRRIEEAA